MTPQDRAKAEGHAIFASGVKCQRGHIGIRYTKTNACVDCVREAKARAAEECPAYVAPSKKLRLCSGDGGAPIKLPVHGEDTRQAMEDIQGLYKTIIGRKPSRALVIARALQMCREILQSLTGNEDAIRAEREKIQTLAIPVTLKPA